MRPLGFRSDKEPETWWSRFGLGESTVTSAGDVHRIAITSMVFDAMRGGQPLATEYIRGTAKPSELAAALRDAGGTVIAVEHDSVVSIWSDAFASFQPSYMNEGGMFLMSNNKELFSKIRDAASMHIARGDSKKHLHALIADEDGKVAVRQLGKVDCEITRGNYSPDVLDGFDAVIADLKADKPRGRISIFDGPPGTGKTYLIRSIITSVEAKFILCPPKLVAKLGDPQFVAMMRDDTKRTVLILEDADEILSPRKAQNMDGIMAALNMGDGLLGEVLNVSLVATTNAPIGEMDPAILRPGRLSRRVSVGPLDAAQAAAVYERLTGKAITFDAPKTLAEVYGEAGAR